MTSCKTKSMPSFSSKERSLAQVLNKFPLLKHFIKTGYIYLCDALPVVRGK
jgi:hypothetical protein